eukprot:UN24190
MMHEHVRRYGLIIVIFVALYINHKYYPKHNSLTISKEEENRQLPDNLIDKVAHFWSTSTYSLILSQPVNIMKYFVALTLFTELFHWNLPNITALATPELIEFNHGSYPRTRDYMVPRIAEFLLPDMDKHNVGGYVSNLSIIRTVCIISWLAFLFLHPSKTPWLWSFCFMLGSFAYYILVLLPLAY